MTDRENKTALTAQEVADILKISKNTVYELIKRGEINSYKVGRKVRFTYADVENYINSSRSSGPPAASEWSSSQIRTRAEARDENFIICGQDFILDVLSNYLAAHPWGQPALRAHVGSYDGLVALYRGEVQAATAHLWDGDTGEYNRPFVRRLMPGIRTVIIRLAWRTQGFYVAAGNPKNIRSWEDLTRPGITLVNREKGAGSRVLLDEHLRLLGVFGRSIRGYANEGQSHHAVASAVGRGEADVAVGHQRAAELVSGVDFIPLQREQYDLVVRLEDMERSVVKAMLEILRSERFKREFMALAGYDLAGLGQIVGET